MTEYETNIKKNIKKLIQCFEKRSPLSKKEVENALFDQKDRTALGYVLRVNKKDNIDKLVEKIGDLNIKDLKTLIENKDNIDVELHIKEDMIGDFLFISQVKDIRENTLNLEENKNDNDNDIDKSTISLINFLSRIASSHFSNEELKKNIITKLRCLDDELNIMDNNDGDKNLNSLIKEITFDLRLEVIKSKEIELKIGDDFSKSLNDLDKYADNLPSTSNLEKEKKKEAKSLAENFATELESAILFPNTFDKNQFKETLDDHLSKTEHLVEHRNFLLKFLQRILPNSWLKQTKGLTSVNNATNNLSTFVKNITKENKGKNNQIIEEKNNSKVEEFQNIFQAATSDEKPRCMSFGMNQ